MLLTVNERKGRVNIGEFYRQNWISFKTISFDILKYSRRNCLTAARIFEMEINLHYTDQTSNKK